MTVTRAQCDQMIAAYPELKKDRGARRLFVHLLRGRVMIDPNDGRIIIPCWLLAQFEGQKQKHCRTEDLLTRFARLFPDFVYQDYYYQGHQCRRIIATGIPEMFYDLFTEWGFDRVYVDTLKPQSYKDRLARLSTAKREAMSYVYPYKEADAIAHYHLGHSLPDFMTMIDRHFQHAWDLALQLEQREHHLRVLQEIYDQPVPIYFPSSKSKTPRIFTNGLGYLQSDLRHILCQDWIELDLKSCQLAVAAMLGNIVSLRTFLLNGGNIWATLLEALGLPKEAKKIIKEGVYSIIYGKAGRAVQADLEKHLAEKGWTATSRLIDHPLMRDLLRAIRALKKGMQERKGWEGAFGWVAMEEGEDIDSFLSRVIQSYELKLIYTCYEVAFSDIERKKCSFDILLHQHDGISIKLRPYAQREVIVARIKQAVLQKAKAMNIVTWIED